MVGGRARATKTSPAPPTVVGLAPWGVPSDPATLEPTSPCEFRTHGLYWLSRARSEICRFVPAEPTPRSLPTAGACPSPAARIEGIDQARRSAGQWSPATPLAGGGGGSDRAVLLGSCLVPTRARFRLGFDQRDFNRSEGTRLARAHAAVRNMSQKVVTRGRIMVCIQAATR